MENFIVRFLSDPLGTISSIFSGNGGPLGEAWSFIRGLLFTLDFILLIAFIAVFFVSLKYRPKLHPKHGVVKRILTARDAVFTERWQNILEKVSAGTPDAVKVAIIEADKLTDDVLKRLGLAGEHMADRLEKLFPQELRSLDRIWRAHRVRNNLVHNPEYQLTGREAEKTVKDYETFLREVKVL